MKKLILSLGLPALALTAAAQAPVLDSGDVGAAGSTYYMATDTLIDPTMDEGPSGASVTWDYRSLGWQEVDTVKFVTPASTGHAADFPTANLAVSDPSGAGAVFMENSSSRLEVLGAAGDPFGVGISMLLQFDPTQTLAEFPFTYGDSFLDTLGIYYADTTSLLGALADSARYTSTVYRNVTADAWGTLMLGGGTYNALRMKQIERSVDVVEMHTPFGWVPVSNTDVTDTAFIWWGETRGYLLAQANISGGRVSSIQYLDPNSVGVEDPAANYAASVYPNPTSGKVLVNVPDRQAAVLEVLDLRGAKVATLMLDGLSTEADLSGLVKGMYLWRVNTAAGKPLANGHITLMR